LTAILEKSGIVDFMAFSLKDLTERFGWAPRGLNAGKS
jgi:hypothetical protein